MNRSHTIEPEISTASTFDFTMSIHKSGHGNHIVLPRPSYDLNTTNRFFIQAARTQVTQRTHIHGESFSCVFHNI